MGPFSEMACSVDESGLAARPRSLRRQSVQPNPADVRAPHPTKIVSSARERLAKLGSALLAGGTRQHSKRRLREPGSSLRHFPLERI